MKVQWQSLMMTEAGKIQGTCWSFGALTGYEHKYANYAVKNPTDRSTRLGTEAYRQYMDALAELEPNVFVNEHEPLPDALGFDELDHVLLVGRVALRRVDHDHVDARLNQLTHPDLDARGAERGVGGAGAGRPSAGFTG